MNEAFISDVLITIIKMTLTGSIVTLLLFFAKPIIKNRLPKAFQYYTWLIVIGAFMIPLSKYIILPLETTSLPFTTISETVDQYIVTAQEAVPLQETATQSVVNQPQTAEIKAPISIGANWVQTLFLLIWAIGFFVFLGVNLFGYFVFIWKILQSSSLVGDVETSMLVALMQHRRPPVLYRNKLTPTPMLIGVIHPIMILPDKEYTPIQLKNILLHELIHFRRKDVFIKWIMMIANAIHWFNPLVYFVRRELDHMCELACDEAVIKNLTTYEKQEYGNTLISVVAEKKLPKAVLSTTMSQEKKALKERLGAIMNNKNTTRKALIISGVLFVIILCATIVIGASKLSKDTNNKWDNFPNTMVENGLLSAEIVEALPDYRVDSNSYGNIFHLWSQWNDEEGSFIHKIELEPLNDELAFYAYTDYFFNAPKLETPLTIDEGSELVKRFAAIFFADYDTLKFVNKPAYFSRYDEGHVESWVAEDNDINHIIMVDLDIGCVTLYYNEPKAILDNYELEQKILLQEKELENLTKELKEKNNVLEAYRKKIGMEGILEEYQKEIAEHEELISQIEETIETQKKALQELYSK